MTIDLTGVWQCDDQGTYYIRQIGNTVVGAGLHDSGFHKGIEFAKVVSGTLSTDEGSVIGEWVDVPRGGAESSGILRLTITDGFAVGNVVPALVQDPKATSGGFGGKSWLKYGEIDAPWRISFSGSDRTDLFRHRPRSHSAATEGCEERQATEACR